jgi:hypothetical protein
MKKNNHRATGAAEKGLGFGHFQFDAFYLKEVVKNLSLNQIQMLVFNLFEKMRQNSVHHTYIIFIVKNIYRVSKMMSHKN